MSRSKVLIIDDDEMMAECMTYALPHHRVRTCANAIDAMHMIDEDMPDVIVLDILLDGPDGFTLLNELISYDDTVKLPVVIVSSLDLSRQDLSHYGVVEVLQKETMTPQMLQEAIQNA